MRRHKFIYIILFLIVGIISSCSTKKDTFANRAFHNVTSYYNGYWNARNILNLAVKDMQDQAIDNFYEIPPLIYYGDAKVAQNIKPELDNAIEKSHLVIKKHSMLIKHKERVKWIDDLYFVIGKSYFYEHEYTNARRTFQHILKSFPQKNIQNSANLWLAKTYIQIGDFEKAQAALEGLQKKVEKFEVSRAVQKEYPIARAELYLAQGKHDLAVPFIEEVLKQNKRDRIIKQRANYLLGRIAHENNNLAEASKYYKKASKGRNFNMAFNAKLKYLQCSDDVAKGGDAIIKKLNRMLREDKNAEFRDQIYFALYEVYKRQGNEEKQIESLRNSVGTSVSNEYQKAISANILADLLFSKKRYIESQPYYDTTIQFLPVDFPNYVEINERTHILTDLVLCLTNVQTEDSLQKLAKMSEKDRMDVINKIIADLKEQERIQKEIEMQQQRNYASSMASQYENQRLMGRLGQDVSANWYFNNPQMVSSGITEFKKRWGIRKYEDLWFLKDKQSFSWDELDEIAQDSTLVDTIDYVTDEMDPQFYLQYIPLTEEQMKASNDKIEQSLYDAGFIAADRLNDQQLSNECFSELIRRFPESEYILMSYYMNYINCKEINDTKCMEETKNKILTKFPDSDYAKILIDPSYIITLQNELDASKNLYKDIFYSYQDGMFDLVELYAEEGIALDDPEYVPKFLYISALTDLAKEDDTASIVKLQTIIDNYMGTDIASAAQDLLYMLVPEEMMLDSSAMAEIEQQRLMQEMFEKEIAQYTYNCSSNHFYVIIINNKKANVRAAAIRVSDYLRRYHRLDNLESKELMLNDTLEMITITSFNTCTKALDFYNKVMLNNYIFSGMTADSYYHFIISQDNYPLFYRSKNIDAYLYFFNDRILKANKF